MGIIATISFMSDTFIKQNFKLTTWLTLGACMQSILVLLLPTRIALLPAAVLLLVKIVDGMLITKGFTRNPSLPTPYLKRMSAPIPDADGSPPEKNSDKGIVVFVVGANYNHPLGLFAPGFKSLSTYFQNMWLEAGSDKEKWGFLGKTDNMTMVTPGGGNALISISYWKTIEHLHAFARGPSHTAGWNWWADTQKQWPHIGIMHETYNVPAGSWENIYQNFHPIGMGQIKHKVYDKEAGKVKLMNPLMEVKGGKWRSMLLRMGAEEKEEV